MNKTPGIRVADPLSIKEFTALLTSVRSFSVISVLRGRPMALMIEATEEEFFGLVLETSRSCNVRFCTTTRVL